MSNEVQPPSELARRRVEHFKSPRAGLPLHPAERGLLVVICIHLCFLPWALGCMHPSAQLTSLGLALIGFALALRRRLYPGGIGSDPGPYRHSMAPRLLRFPIFWLGAALLALVGVQALNPSWAYTRSATRWWLARVPDIAWLPTSVDVPFARFNAFRQWIVYASVWLQVCSVWVGLTRRRSLRIILGVLVCNALALCVLMGIQHITGDRRIPWPLTAWTDAGLTASFIYSNHAGAYLALVTFPAIALATWYFDYGARTLSKSSPAGVLALAALFLAFSVVFTLSRGASLTLAAMVVMFLGWYLLRRKLGRATVDMSPRITYAIVFIFVAFFLNSLRYLDFSAALKRFDDMAALRTGESSVHSRVLAHQAAADMLKANWLRGVGAGCFRHLFPEYVSHYPEIYNGGYNFWEHAHGDWFEIPIELGLAGDLLLLACGAWWISWFVRRRALWHSLAIPLLLGCLQTLVHAWFDFPFQCPAILATWCVLLTLAGRWIELEPSADSHEAPRPSPS